jgi:hypothetical protein
LIGRRLLYFVYAHSPFAIPTVLRNDPYSQYFAALVLASAVICFLFFRIAARLSAATAVLRISAGVVAVAGLPLSLRLIQPFPVILFVEIIAASVCVLMYVFGKWNVPYLISILLLGLHFAFWSWGALHQMFFWPLYPVIGFCSALVWALYLKQSAQRPVENGAAV